jgi:hypothetical protein
MFFSSTMIEQGDLADRISSRSSDLKDWLMTMDILKVLEGVVKLMKTVSVLYPFPGKRGKFTSIFPDWSFNFPSCWHY